MDAAIEAQCAPIDGRGFTARGQSACMYDAKLIEYLKRDWKPDSRRM
jgi:hypothetical protein